MTIPPSSFTSPSQLDNGDLAFILHTPSIPSQQWWPHLCPSPSRQGLLSPQFPGISDNHYDRHLFWITLLGGYTTAYYAWKSQTMNDTMNLFTGFVMPICRNFSEVCSQWWICRVKDITNHHLIVLTNYFPTRIETIYTPISLLSKLPSPHTFASSCSLRNNKKYICILSRFLAQNC